MIVVLAGVAVVGVLTLLVKQEPGYYTADAGDEIANAQVASEVLTRFGDLMNDVRLKSEWNGSFTASELNAFLRENLQEDGWLARVLPPELHAPRVAIDGDRVKVAGRVGDGFWSTVVSAELRVWLVKDEVNTVAVELVGMRRARCRWNSSGSEGWTRSPRRYGTATWTCRGIVTTVIWSGCSDSTPTSRDRRRSCGR